MDENNKKRKISKKKKKTSKAWEKVMSSFTDDLWIEIFLYLPFKSLLRFKSVSKSWLSIISNHRFAKSYLDTDAKDDNECPIVHHEIGDIEEEEDGPFSLFNLDLGDILKHLQFPYSQGCDCGIVSVSVDLSYWRAAKKKYDVYLWNPTTKHSKLIPPFTIEPNNDWTTLGFGFDHIDLDFKVVRVVFVRVVSTSAEVYSSNRNGWLKIESELIDTPASSSFLVFHGFLFAIGDTNSMMAFNLNKEVFIYGIKLPISNFDNDTSFIDITYFKDNIGVINSIVNEGVPIEFLKVLYSNSQCLLFEKDEDRFSYMWNNKVTTNIPTRPYLERGEIFKYTKSLFSLVGFKRIKWAASSPRLEDSSDSDE
ncbi:F-box domain-containing protein [Heracleum sosnowskyi]|uniref:F-box domain-containing protein n=1 Tax=Heracleum sosnowskyi TaxID=360622 RepID=A0AAD8MQE4_9APIA|nr:F-box domain-containing protein [Heracleum sosnowskyi]